MNNNPDHWKLNLKKKHIIQEAREDRRKLAESSLVEFIKLIHPNRLLGLIHLKVIDWWTATNANPYQILLLPRDHMKSALIAYRAVWELTRDPTLRILFVSANSNLAIKQLKFIKDILTSDTYRLYWPEMVNKEEVKREKWTEREISIDHPLRKEEAIRDPSIFTAGLTSNIVGMHCDIAILDDVVVTNNAYTEEGRNKVLDQYSFLSSIEGAGAKEWIVGTRYHPDDLYARLLERTADEYDDTGNLISTNPLFDVKEFPVESVGDGTGEFLWPRQQRTDGKWFGFDAKVLADKRNKYLNKIHFRAQYYNDPRDVDASPISRDCFQYYERTHLFSKDGKWHCNRNRLNVAAAVDFAYTTGKSSDYTAIVVIGADSFGNYYVLEIDRFKTGRPSDYFIHIIKLFEKWGFRKVRFEVSGGQKTLVEDFKENYIRPLGLGLSVDEYRPPQWAGSKEERILSILEPRYQNKQMWHYMGGHCQTLEEELMFANPSHDDCKDALASAVDFVTQPMNSFLLQKAQQPVYNYHSKFGGVTG